MTIAAIIPALDEAQNISAMVHDCLANDVDLVVVVDNGSRDDTASVAQAAGATVVSEVRRGYGFACAAGSTTAQQMGAEILIYLDADHSSRPSEIDRVLAPIRGDNADLVLGSRVNNTAPGAMPAHQRFGNWLSALLMRRLYDLDVTDLGPFRAIKADVLSDLDMQEMTFGWPTEMTVKAAKAGAAIVEVPVSWDARNAGRSKVGGTLKGSVLAARYILGVTIRHAR